MIPEADHPALLHGGIDVSLCRPIPVPVIGKYVPVTTRILMNDLNTSRHSRVFLNILLLGTKLWLLDIWYAQTQFVTSFMCGCLPAIECKYTHLVH